MIGQRGSRDRGAHLRLVQVPGCKTNFYYFIGAMAVLSILGSTSRVGNVLVALRCVEVRDKALSFAIQVNQWSKGVDGILRSFHN